MALALCSASLCLSYSASSDAQDVTGNLVYTTLNPPPAGIQYTWTGFVNNNTGGGGTSGGNVPAYNSKTGTFIFGYNQGTVAYGLAVNTALANSGSGLQVAGYNYSWTYYNQDYSRGTLSGTIGLTNNAGKVLESYNYTMPKTTTGWTTMSGSQTFTSDYSLASLGNLTVSFTGKDDRYWAGYYGPQIRDIDVRLRYAAAPVSDPCETNPSQNPNCPGYLQAISKYITPASTTTTSTESLSPISGSSTSVTTVATTSSTSSVPIITETPTTTTTTTSSTTPTSTVGSTTNTSVTPSATNPQPRVGEVTVSGSPAQTTTSQSSLSVGQALSIIRSEQNRVSRLEANTVAAAVEQATRDSEKATTEAQATAVTQQTAAAAANESVLAAIAPTAAPQLGSGLQINAGGANGFSVLRDPVSGMPNSIQQNTVITSFSSVSPMTNSATNDYQTQSFARRQMVEEANQSNNENNASTSAFSATSPLNNYVNPPTAPAESTTAATGPVVNRNVQPNSAAGGRDITVIATAPPGFDMYTAGNIPDGAFYAPKEIYRNQRTVDNARAQRALSGGSDRLHQEMIDRQYRISQ